MIKKFRLLFYKILIIYNFKILVAKLKIKTNKKSFNQKSVIFNFQIYQRITNF